MLWLSVWKQAPQSLAFYRKWGFERVGEDRFMLGHTVYEDWLLQRDVQSARPLVTLRRCRAGDAGPILALFRDTIRRRAVSTGVSGWVRNRADGTVEAVLEGEPHAVERLVELCRKGPRSARVDRLDVVGEEPEGLAGFTIR